ncbi:hypothetical protein LU293_05285 [Moraxella nasovis]|uniref:hypothetical protein n=1 Tax=Moraxella nasovis TaxID=2904121 RepID=UPI001F60F182|nr:hypothetical protein [Moraxella nasovis]UNU72538.1 hypothetical protein LU293_05285 [Moraxella nasovis]
MKLISDFSFSWKDELKLTSAFIINRLMPILVFFTAFILVLNKAEPNQIDEYSIYSSVYNSALAFGLGMTSGIRFYSTYYAYQRLSLLLVSFALFLGILIFGGFLIYTNNFLPSSLQNNTVALMFALLFPVVFCYEFLVILGESKKAVKASSISNLIALPIFLMVFFVILWVLPNQLTTVELVSMSQLITECLLLTVLMVYIRKFAIIDDCQNNGKGGIVNQVPMQAGNFYIIKSIVVFSFPIIVLQFLKRVAQSQSLLFVSDVTNSVGILQTLFMLAVLFSVFAAAFANNGFVVLAKEYQSWKISSWCLVRSYFLYNAILLVFTSLLLLFFIFLLNVCDIYDIKNQPFVNFLRHNNALIFIFLLSDMVFWSLLMYVRALGDSWRMQTVWIVVLGVLLGVGLFLFDVNLPLIITIFLLANVISSLFSLYWIYRHIDLKIKAMSFKPKFNSP